MVKKISLINFKGGVAKTTIAVNLAAELADRENNVLLVDLDPQSNSSMWLLGEQRFEQRVKELENTVYQLFLDYTDRYHEFQFEKAVVKGVVQDKKGVQISPRLDLLPNTYYSIKLESKLMAQNPNFDILKRQLENIQDKYDFIILDCAPNLYNTTKNALFFSNYYVVPVYPDYFAQIGLRILCVEINEIMNQLESFRTEDKLRLSGAILARIKVNSFDVRKRVGLERMLIELKREGIVDSRALVFQTYFNDSVEVGRSIESFVPTKYSKRSSEPIKEYSRKMESFTNELLENLERD